MAPRRGRIYTLRPDDMRRALAVQGAILGLGLLSFAIGWLIVSGHLLIAALLCIALPMVCVVAWAGLSAIAGVILLLTLNGIPGIDLTRFNVHGSFESLDICAVCLILLAAGRYFFGTREAGGQHTERLVAWSAVFLAVWAVALVKGLDRGVPVLTAALFGRDFLFFALLVPFAKALVKTNRELTRLVAVVGAMTTVYALGEIATTFGVLRPNVINDIQVLRVGPLTRVYSNMNDLVALGFSCALAYSVLHTGRRSRLAAAIAIVCGVAVVLQLTQAMYVGLAIGMILAFLIWTVGGFQLRFRLRHRLLWAVVGTLAFSFGAVVVAPHVLSSSSIQTITNRIGAGVSDVESSRRVVGGSANTVAYREQVASIMRQILGSHWILGLGFLHPSVVYFSQLPHGSIRNNDTGLFNGLMTMGVVGTALIYIPVIMGLGCIVPGSADETRWAWLRLGSMIWMISALAGSLTLVTLFSTNGLTLTAVLLGIIFGVARPRGNATGSSRGA